MSDQPPLDTVAALEPAAESGTLLLCTWCGRIQDDLGRWSERPASLCGDIQSAFTRGTCPDCLKRKLPANLNGSETPVGPTPPQL